MFQVKQSIGYKGKGREGKNNRQVDDLRSAKKERPRR